MQRIGGQQTSLDKYIKKKAIWPSNQQNDKSKKALVILEVDQSTEETHVQLQVFSKQTSIKAYQVCVPLVLISPIDTIFYEPYIKPKLKQLFSNYSKEGLLKLILHNMRFHQVENVQNLNQILTDRFFWEVTLNELLFLLINEIDTISSSIRLLTSCQNQIVELSRKQVLLLLASMFFGIMPKQFHQSQTTFGNLMQNERKQGFNRIKIEKLKCIASYFNSILGCLQKNVQVLDQTVQIRRTFLTSHLQQDSNKNVKMKRVEVRSLVEEGIEDYYCKGIMIDFANKRLGGGILKNGCVQEEILFSIFPELIVTKLLCSQLQDREAVIVYGARRFCYYDGYRQTFRFNGSCFEDYLPSDYQRSILVAIDAYDFSNTKKSNYCLEQYSKRGIKREMIKAVTGFKGAAVYADGQFPICTGRWGCGAFGADEDIKFIIQWIACSMIGRDMVYITQNSPKIINFRCLVQQFKDETTDYLYQILEEYCSFRQCLKKPHKPTLLDYIKNEVI